MGIFKRICMLIYSLAGFVLFGAFIISTQASMTPLAQYVMTYAVVRHALPACGVILFIGCVVMFLRAVFTRNRRVVIITKTKDNQITVSRNAIRGRWAFSRHFYLLQNAQIWSHSPQRAHAATYYRRPHSGRSRAA